MHKREMDEQLIKIEEMHHAHERLGRELRAQMQVKNKEILNQREELAELESRLNIKLTELRNVKTQLVSMQTRYEDALNQIDRLQFDQAKRTDRCS